MFLSVLNCCADIIYISITFSALYHHRLKCGPGPRWSHSYTLFNNLCFSNNSTWLFDQIAELLSFWWRFQFQICPFRRSRLNAALTATRTTMIAPSSTKVWCVSLFVIHRWGSVSIGHPITNVDNPRLCYVPGPSLPYTFCRGGYKSVKRSDGSSTRARSIYGYWINTLLEMKLILDLMFFRSFLRSSFSVLSSSGSA